MPGGGCCGPAEVLPAELAVEIGYSADEIAALPPGANLGLSCGNPTAIASLRPGEVVLDLGSGGGLDVFLAGPKVGPRGQAIGIDMTPEMLENARRGIERYRERTGLDNVEFRLGEIEHLPVADASVDVVISNCVINLAPDKAQVWREIARVLKPGGRVVVSDTALLKPLPPAAAAGSRAWVGCVAGAMLVEETRAMLAAAGLADVRLTPRSDYVEALKRGNARLYREVSALLPAGEGLEAYLTSLAISARKPAR
jgi:SAM-dependent methyltransferase